MKKILNKLYIIPVVLTAVILNSCSDYLDINKNPNSATSASPDLVISNALTSTASWVAGTYNDYGAWHVGYFANAGGYGGWGSVITYDYTTADYSNLWNIYDNLNDYQYVESSSKNDDQLAYYRAMAKVMKVYDFQMLVDAYNDIPYSEALKGDANVTPSYDSAPDVYKDMVAQLDSSITIINGVTSQLSVGPEDVLFNGDMDNWKRFANTLKLRLLIRAQNSSISDFVQSELNSFDTSIGFISDDAIVNPGYTVSSGKQNPFWNTYHSGTDGTVTGSARSRIPTYYIFGYYDGTKLSDENRGKVTYYGFDSGDTPLNQLGYTGSDAVPYVSGHPSWYIGEGTGTNTENTVGILKGRTMGQPIFLLADSEFLQAEAALNGYSQFGNAEDHYRAGVTASFRYLYKNVDNNVESGYDPEADAAEYMDVENAGNYLADYSAATTNSERLEAIITQKYIALNMINNAEAWNEYRRTGFPANNGKNNAANKYLSFSSITSSASRSDKLPTRILYPSDEFGRNADNVPKGIDSFTTLIFWAK
ncbi:SusD/RagB family nutrient-binding outer membrane lipoprotein [Zhouia sp. PK063]|uniref:SusD/RagB family nutrient-binding outer membrane lipoprotein n=1 Tax=Zhouia sp. PK063 TaxID=3373602 RepID=UPI00379E0C40